VEAKNVCNVCGSEDRRVGNPAASVNIPNNPFFNVQQVTCQQVEIAGLVGLIPIFACPLFAENAVFKLYCSCEDNYDDQTAMNHTDFPKNSTVYQSNTNNETEAMDVGATLNDDRSSKVPNLSPAAPAFKKNQKSDQASKQYSINSNVPPSITPQQPSLILPSILPSDTPSVQPSSQPSMLLSSTPSVLSTSLLLEIPEITNENNVSERGSDEELGDPCFVCGNEARKVGNPNAEIIVPNNPFFDLEQVTCQQVELAGRFGMIPPSACPFFETNDKFQVYCDCEDKYYKPLLAKNKSADIVSSTIEDSNSDRQLQFEEASLSDVSSHKFKFQAQRRRLRLRRKDVRL
jgi:hypothetical protein